MDRRVTSVVVILATYRVVSVRADGSREILAQGLSRHIAEQHCIDAIVAHRFVRVLIEEEATASGDGQAIYTE